MPNLRSAKKRLRQDVRRRARNRWRKERVKLAVKDLDDALKAGDKAKAEELLRAAYKQIDQVAAKGTIHKNTAARHKSRLAKRLATI